MTNTTPEGFNRYSAGHLPGVLGVEIVTITREAVASRMSVKREVMAPNGYLHAASVIAAREGAIACRATPVHLGRTTQVWDAVEGAKWTPLPVRA